MDDDELALGPCCMCGRAHEVRTIIMLDRRGAIPGHGWGCVQCGLPMDGVCAVLCDECVEVYRRNPYLLQTACRGYPATEGRIPLAELPEGDFQHDMSRHAEEATPPPC